MFNNIGRKIKALAKVIFVISVIFWCFAGIAAAFSLSYFRLIGRSSGGIAVLQVFLSILAFALIAGIGFLVSWIGSFFMYGLGQLIEDTEIIRQTNQLILEKVANLSVKNSAPRSEDKPPFTRTVPPVTRPVPPVAPEPPKAPDQYAQKEASASWYCIQCGEKNRDSSKFCVNCGAPHVN